MTQPTNVSERCSPRNMGSVEDVDVELQVPWVQPLMPEATIYPRAAIRGSRYRGLLRKGIKGAGDRNSQGGEPGAWRVLRNFRFRFGIYCLLFWLFFFMFLFGWARSLSSQLSHRQGNPASLRFCIAVSKSRKDQQRRARESLESCIAHTRNIETKGTKALW